MPVTINGNGSISGLSVGGLGAGVVNTATLADGAAVGTKLGTGAILQVKQAETSSQITSSSGDFDIVSVTLTPTATGNKIFISEFL